MLLWLVGVVLGAQLVELGKIIASPVALKGGRLKVGVATSVGCLAPTTLANTNIAASAVSISRPNLLVIIRRVFIKFFSSLHL